MIRTREKAKQRSSQKWFKNSQNCSYLWNNAQAGQLFPSQKKMERDAKKVRKYTAQSADLMHEVLRRKEATKFNKKIAYKRRDWQNRVKQKI